MKLKLITLALATALVASAIVAAPVHKHHASVLSPSTQRVLLGNSPQPLATAHDQKFMGFGFHTNFNFLFSNLKLMEVNGYTDGGTTGYNTGVWDYDQITERKMKLQDGDFSFDKGLTDTAHAYVIFRY